MHRGHGGVTPCIPDYLVRNHSASGNAAADGRAVCLPQVAFHKFDRAHSGKTSSYNLRPLLWEAGGTASNKVLECLVLRFAKNKVLTSECFVMAMVRLHLAHGEYPTRTHSGSWERWVEHEAWLAFSQLPVFSQNSLTPISGVKVRPACEADNPTAICELSRKCGSLDVSTTYWPPLAITECI
jgi:hypothetical protein